MSDVNLPDCPEARSAVLAVGDVTEEGGSAEVRAKILHLEAEMKQMPDQIELPVVHHFAPGVYAREMRLPKGCIATGKIHRHAHLNIISRGRITVVTEFGNEVIDATQGPVTSTSRPGSKRAVYVDEDTVWTTIHPTQETDLARIEKEVVADSYDELSLACPTESLKIEGETP